jgi:hypothetical protein
MHWQITNRADPEANRMAKQHYTCQSPNSGQFMPPGSCMVLKISPMLAVWGTSWPKAEFVQHAWAGAWMCSIFRNNGAGLSSELILEAVAATKWFYQCPPCAVPELGMVTFIDTRFVKGPHYGYCYKRAGFIHVGETKGGLLAFQLKPDDMPISDHPLGAQAVMDLFV